MGRKRKSEKANPMPVEAIEAPAKIRPTHRQDRTLSIVAGATKGYTNDDWPISIAHKAGRLDGADGKGELRWQAVRAYNELCEVSRGGSRDSTNLDVVKGGGGFPISEAMADALKMKISIDSLLNARDRAIVWKLCEGWSLPGAVKLACGDDYKFAVAARVRDALDALIQAMHGAKRAGYTFDLRSL